MTTPTHATEVRPGARLADLADYIIPFSIRAACDLGIADHLTDGPCHVDELARRTGTHPRSLLRLLRALAARGIFTETSPQTFDLTPLADPLRSDHPDSLRKAYPLMACDIGAWAGFAHSLRTGAAAFDQVHGEDYWTYLAANPAESARFDASQGAVTRREIAALLPAYPWDRFGTLVDVGGGSGAFLAAILTAHPGLRGVLFDQPHVVAGTDVPTRAGVQDRCQVVGGDFRRAVPAGGDGYVIKRAFYDLDDEDAVAFLRAVRSVIAPDGRLLIIEPMIEPGDGFDWGKLYDVLLLTMRGGGSRSREELTALFGRTGFELTDVVRTKSLPIVEARPV
ncbi:methyltransferase [Micromonospora sp. DT229]|uniref:methyltransferase n=1 Tax=Micromonospora sp. DT229 TaxID=3393430 RepID=UPI003CF320CA